MRIRTTLFLPDLNAWLALSVGSHPHTDRAWRWLDGLQTGSRLLFCRYTQMGLLRLLTNSSVMGEQTLVLKKAWAVYDQWVEDFRVEFQPEPRGLETLFRGSMRSLAAQPASKAIGDCYLLAFAQGSRATLVTFDTALYGLADRQGARAALPD